MSAAEAAPRVEGRTIDVELPAPYEGWEATMRTDFPARFIEELDAAADWPAMCRLLDTWLVVDHNFPDIHGNTAATMLDVYPVQGVIALWAAFKKATNTLPNT